MKKIPYEDVLQQVFQEVYKHQKCGQDGYCGKIYNEYFEMLEENAYIFITKHYKKFYLFIDIVVDGVHNYYQFYNSKDCPIQAIHNMIGNWKLLHNIEIPDENDVVELTNGSYYNRSDYNASLKKYYIKGGLIYKIDKVVINFQRLFNLMFEQQNYILNKNTIKNDQLYLVFIKNIFTNEINNSQYFYEIFKEEISSIDLLNILTNIKLILSETLEMETT